MIKVMILAALMALSVSVNAHEGHDAVPGAIKANHGGTVKAGKEINLEYVVTGTEVKMYPVSHDGKDLSPTDVKLTVTAKAPKGKADAVKVENKDGAFVGSIDFKSAYRMEVSVDATVANKKSTFKFQVEK